MQTFLPYESFRKSAACLDNKRLGKQRVEAKQLLLALGVPVGEHTPTGSAWVNHPAARMWRGYEIALAEYAAVVCREWRNRGYKDVLLPQFRDVYASLQSRIGVDYHPEIPMVPPWLGGRAFHASHRSNLLRKDPIHYGQFGWSEPHTLEYVWPVSAVATA